MPINHRGTNERERKSALELPASRTPESIVGSCKLFLQVTHSLWYLPSRKIRQVPRSLERKIAPSHLSGTSLDGRIRAEIKVSHHVFLSPSFRPPYGIYCDVEEGGLKLLLTFSSAY